MPLGKNKHFESEKKFKEELHALIHSEFDFLITEYGFEISLVGEAFMIYRKGNLGIRIGCSRDEIPYNFVRVGLFKENARSEIFMQYEFRLYDLIKFKKANFSEALLDNLRWNNLRKEQAKMLKEDLSDVLSGNVDIFPAVAKVLNEPFLMESQASAEEDFRRIIAVATEFFEQKDYESVIFHLDEHENKLSGEALQMLQYAKKNFKRLQ